MTAKKKSAAKTAVRPSGRVFSEGFDPRRGRGPQKGAPNAGRPPDEFRALMRELASSPEAIDRLRDILSGYLEYEDAEGRMVRIPVDNDTFLKAHAHATDRGYGKAQQHLDVTTGGESLTRDQIATMSVAQLRAEIAARLARA